MLTLGKLETLLWTVFIVKFYLSKVEKAKRIQSKVCELSWEGLLFWKNMFCLVLQIKQTKKSSRLNFLVQQYHYVRKDNI